MATQTKFKVGDTAYVLNMAGPHSFKIDKIHVCDKFTILYGENEYSRYCFYNAEYCFASPRELIDFVASRLPTE